MNRDGRRLMEDYLPIKAISAEASREKFVQMAYFSPLHFWYQKAKAFFLKFWWPREA